MLVVRFLSVGCVLQLVGNMRRRAHVQAFGNPLQSHCCLHPHSPSTPVFADARLGLSAHLNYPTNAACTALTACSPLARSIVTEILISLVEIIPMFTPSFASVSNIFPATPV